MAHAISDIRKTLTDFYYYTITDTLHSCWTDGCQSQLWLRHWLWLQF